MSKLESYIIDIYDDVNLGETLVKIASSLPDDLKRVELPNSNDRDALEDMDFALNIFTKQASKLNKFPIDSRLNTALSNEYFELNHHLLPEEAQKIAATYIKQACSKFGINPKQSVKIASANFPTMTNIYFEKMNDKPAGRVYVEKVAHEESDHYYALVKTAGNGSTNRMYAMPDEQYLRKAERYFDKYASHFPPEDRHEYALNVVKRAAELGVPVESTTIDKYAGLAYSSDLDGHLAVRKKLLDGDSVYNEAYTKLASYQEKVDPTTFAKTLHELDKKAGLNKYYDRYLTDPFAATFGKEATKTASPIYEKDGVTLTENDIEKIAKEKYPVLKNYFGQTLADGLKKEGAPAFTALPDDAKEIIARISSGEIQ